MSQDLFAAFGNETPFEENSTRVNGSRSTPLRSADVSSSSATRYGPSKPVSPQDIVDDEDDFGDFETASSWTQPVNRSVGTQSTGVPSHRVTDVSKPFSGGDPQPSSRDSNTAGSRSVSSSRDAQQASGQHPFAGRMDLLFELGDDEYDAGADELGDLSTNPEAARAYSKILIEQQQNVFRGMTAKKPPSSMSSKPAPPAKVQRQGPNKLRKKSGYVPPKDPNVLFDAENISDEDEQDSSWGDFESKPATLQQNNRKPVSSSGSRTQTMPAIDLLGLDDQPSTTAAASSLRHVVTQAPPPDDDWDDFEAAAPSRPAAQTQAFPPPLQQKTPAPPSLPPTSVPPPASLLSLMPLLLDTLDSSLLIPISQLHATPRQTLLAHPDTHQFITTYISHAQALAHIIAGRKQRWKRDHRLAQSMRIGPAAAGGSKGGMKLAGVDRSEVAKEDREVVDAVRLWRGKVGKLKTAVTTAASAAPGQKLGVVPELAETMVVKALKPAEGGFVAPRACALCGLRREERVAKVDVGVEDSFGEWWIEGAEMHTFCQRFWGEFENQLRSR